MQIFWYWQPIYLAEPSKILVVLYCSAMIFICINFVAAVVAKSIIFKYFGWSFSKSLIDALLLNFVSTIVAGSITYLIFTNIKAEHQVWSTLIMISGLVLCFTSSVWIEYQLLRLQQGKAVL